MTYQSQQQIIVAICGLINVLEIDRIGRNDRGKLNRDETLERYSWHNLFPRTYQAGACPLGR